MSETKSVWVAYTNTDLTEGRGYDVPIATCELEATALRYASKAYVQGCDGPVRKVELAEINGKWYVPTTAVKIVEPTKEDTAVQLKMNARREAMKKAVEAGLSDADILALRS